MLEGHVRRHVVNAFLSVPGMAAGHPSGPGTDALAVAVPYAVTPRMNASSGLNQSTLYRI